MRISNFSLVPPPKYCVYIRYVLSNNELIVWLFPRWALSLFMGEESLQAGALLWITCWLRIKSGNKALTIILIISVRSHQAWMTTAQLSHRASHVWTSTGRAVLTIVFCQFQAPTSRMAPFHSRHADTRVSRRFLFKSPSIVGHCFCKIRVMKLLACCLAMQLKRY